MPITLSARRPKKQTLAEQVKKKVNAAHRYTATRMAWAVVALQGVLLTTLAVTESQPPASGKINQMFWALSHKPMFYPLIAVLIGAPALSLLAWRVKGGHRKLLLIAWPLFIAVGLYFFEHRLRVMIRALAWEYL